MPNTGWNTEALFKDVAACNFPIEEPLEAMRILGSHLLTKKIIIALRLTMTLMQLMNVELNYMPCVFVDMASYIDGMHWMAYCKDPVDWQIMCRPHPQRFFPAWSPFLSKQCWTILKHNVYTERSHDHESRRDQIWFTWTFLDVPFTQMLEGSRLKISTQDFFKICKRKYNLIRRQHKNRM